MDLRYLRDFIVVAEERHFRRAAEKLGIVQPALSVRIQTLERELGVELLQRTRRGAELTEAGRLMLAEARHILSEVERSTGRVRALARGEEGRVEIGFTPSTCFLPFVSDTIRAFRGAFPGLKVTLTELNTMLLMQRLRDHSLDAAFLRPPVDPGDDMTVRVVVEEAMLIALPAGHRLAPQDALPLSALRGETILIRPRPVGIGLQEQVIAACQEAGFNPIISREAAPQMSSILTLVAAGLGVSIIPACLGHLLPDNVEYRPIVGSLVPRAPVAIAYRTSFRSASVANFVNFAIRRSEQTQNPA